MEGAAPGAHRFGRKVGWIKVGSLEIIGVGWIDLYLTLSAFGSFRLQCWPKRPGFKAGSSSLLVHHCGLILGSALERGNLNFHQGED